MSENNFKINEHSLRTAISKVEPDKIVTRGYNQRDLIEKIFKDPLLHPKIQYLNRFN